MKVRAAVLTRTGAPAPYAESRPLEITEVELAPPGPGEVLVRVRACSINYRDQAIALGRTRAIGLQPRIGGLHPDKGWKSLTMFVEKVLPHIKG